MYILTGNKKEIIDSRFVERFCLVEKPDAYIIIASYSTEHMVTIGKYGNQAEADEVLDKLYYALAYEDEKFEMPISSLFYGERAVKDARTKRKGGS